MYLKEKIVVDLALCPIKFVQKWTNKHPAVYEIYSAKFIYAAEISAGKQQWKMQPQKALPPPQACPSLLMVGNPALT